MYNISQRDVPSLQEGQIKMEYIVFMQYLGGLCAALGCYGDVGLGGCGAGGGSGWYWRRGFLIGGDAR